MRKISILHCLGWGFVGATTLSFAAALLFGSPKLSSFVFFSTMLFAYLQFFVFPFRSACAGHSLSHCVFVGWVSFALSQFLFTLLYAMLYPQYRECGWGCPEGNGVVAAAFIGWLPGAFIASLARIVCGICVRDHCAVSRDNVP